MDEASLPDGGPAGDAGAAAGGPAGKASLVAEGSHAIHLMPEAGLEERLFLGVMARPVSFGQVWSFEVDRESARRAFSLYFSNIARPPSWRGDKRFGISAIAHSVDRSPDAGS